MACKPNFREPKGFWEHAWTISEQNPPSGIFRQVDIKWSKFNGVKFAWIPYNRLQDFVKGEQENPLAPSRLNVDLRNRQQWDDNTRCKCNDYVERKVYTCQYGPNVTMVIKDTKDRKRRRHGRKTGCQYNFHACRMRADTNLCCILFKVHEHIDKEGEYCHGHFIRQQTNSNKRDELAVIFSQQEFIDAPKNPSSKDKNLGIDLNSNLTNDVIEECFNSVGTSTKVDNKAELLQLQQYVKDRIHNFEENLPHDLNAMRSIVKNVDKFLSVCHLCL